MTLRAARDTTPVSHHTPVPPHVPLPPLHSPTPTPIVTTPATTGGAPAAVVPATPATGSGRPLVMIGDSLAVGTRDALAADLPGWGVTTSARIGRPLSEGMAILARTKVSDPRTILAFSLFTNDAPTNTAALRSAVLSSLGKLGDHGCAIWATIQRPPWGGTGYAAANGVLARPGHHARPSGSAADRSVVPAGSRPSRVDGRRPRPCDGGRLRRPGADVRQRRAILYGMRRPLRLAFAVVALAAVAPAAAHAALPVGRPLTIAWGGDTTLGSSHGLAPDHGYSELRAITPWLQAADLTAVNSEGTYATGGSSKCGGGDSENCFAFRAPPGNAASLRKAGVDIVNLANNHAHDFGDIGEQQTISALRHRDVAETGRPGEITTLDVPGARVAFVGFSAYPWTASITDLFSARALIRRAKRKANVVVVFIHAGAEGADRTHTPVGTETFLGENRGDCARSRTP